MQSHSAKAPARLMPTASWVMLQSVDVAVVGLLGIIVGALLGGVVQVGVARVERRSTTRRAARLLYGDHVIALSAVRSMAGMEFWWSDEAAPTLDGWRRYREDLAGAMPGPDFQTVELTPDELRKTSLLGSTATHRVLAGVYAELVDRHKLDDEEVTEFFVKLAPHMEGPVTEDSVWITRVSDDVFSPGALAPRSRRQHLKTLRDTLVMWATTNPEWLHAPEFVA